MNDHQILHYFFNNPSAASTKHPIVQNDLYGLLYDVKYDQDTLTKTQVKDMHDYLVTNNEVAETEHSTPIIHQTTKDLTHKSR